MVATMSWTDELADRLLQTRCVLVGRTIDDELALLASLVPLADQDIIELGCGAAKLARQPASR